MITTVYVAILEAKVLKTVIKT